jgi:ribose 5-phosphate isomerase A
VSQTIYEHALQWVPEGGTVGLGSGRASTEFIKLLGARVKAGLRIRGGVPTSDASGRLARELGIPLLSLEEAMPLDVAVDGADEWDDNLNLIKGYGRALVREKIVEAASKLFICLVGPGKHVKVLGDRGKLPVEVVPLALPLARARLGTFGWDPILWTENGKPALTDNGNYILDCAIPPTALITDPAATDTKILAIPGVLGTGLVVGMADRLLLGDEQFKLIMEKTRPAPGATLTLPSSP